MKNFNISQFWLGIGMIVFQLVLEAISIFLSHKISSTGLICLVYWMIWSYYFYDQRGKKCKLKIIPLEKNIEIGDLVEEKGFPLSGITSGITTCIVPDGKDYNNKYARPIQLVVVSDDKLKTGDHCLDAQSNEINTYSASGILAQTVSCGMQYMLKKVEVLQKDMPDKFIQSVIDRKTEDGDTVIVRNNKVFKEEFIIHNKFMLGVIQLFACLVIGDFSITVFDIFKDYPVAKALTISTSVCIITPVLFYSVKNFYKHYTNKK